MMTLAPLLRPAHHRVLSPFREVLAQCHSMGPMLGREKLLTGCLQTPLHGSSSSLLIRSSCFARPYIILGSL